ERLYAGCDAFEHCSFYIRCRCPDDGQIYRLTNGCDARIAAQALHLLPSRIDRVDLTCIAARKHVGDRAATNFSGISACTHHGDAARVEQRVQTVCTARGGKHYLCAHCYPHSPYVKIFAETN